jgi:hypothetical protein
MPHSASATHRELVPHLLVIAGTILFTLMLALWPQSILDAGYRCQMQALFGLRCPFCGMTRDFVSMLHGERPSLNPCSSIAALMIYAVYPAAVAFAWRAKRLDFFHSTVLTRAFVAALAAMLVFNNLR